MTRMAETEAELAAGEGAAAPDWREAIVEPRLREFAGRFAGPGDAVKAAFDLRQKLSNAVVVPGEEASSEDIAAFRRRLGVPDSPDGYAFRAPEGAAPNDADRAFQAEIARLFHAAGVTPTQAEQLNEGWNCLAEASREARQAADNGAREAAESQLRRQWGAEFERNRALAARAVARFHRGDPNELLDLALEGGTVLGSLPSFVRFAASVGRALAEDEVHLGGAGGAGASAKERLDEIHSWQFADDPAQRERYRSQEVQAELKELYRSLHGDAPIVGADGRRA